jgi:hypothetical protein
LTSARALAPIHPLAQIKEPQPHARTQTYERKRVSYKWWRYVLGSPLDESRAPFLITRLSPSSLRHRMRGDGWPVALQVSVAFSPSCTVMSELVCSSLMSGGTATLILILVVIINLSTERLIFVLAEAARCQIVFPQQPKQPHFRLLQDGYL